MGIPLESGRNSSKTIEEPRLPNTARISRVKQSDKSSLAGKSNQRKSVRQSTDSIGYYLSTIGRVPLLTPAEEIELAHHVQNMKRIMQAPDQDRKSVV